MWVRSFYDGATGWKYGVVLKSRGNGESTCVWHFKKLVKSDRMYAQICFGNYLFKLFKKKKNVQTSISVFCCMHFNLNCKLTLQSLVLHSVSDLNQTSVLVWTLVPAWHRSRSMGKFNVLISNPKILFITCLVNETKIYLQFPIRKFCPCTSPLLREKKKFD